MTVPRLVGGPKPEPSRAIVARVLGRARLCELGLAGCSVTPTTVVRLGGEIPRTVAACAACVERSATP